MKVIEIKQTQRGDIAYIWDEQKQEVMKVWVKDYTRQTDPDPEYEDEEEKFIPKLKTPKIISPKEPVLEMDEDGLPKLERGEQPKTIIPPGMRGMFIEHDQPGASVERRKL